VDKDKQAKLEAKGWVFGDADDFLRPDTKQICEAIKGLPDNDRLQLHVRPTYKSDEWGMNRYLTTESDASIATDDLKALVAENEALRERVADANRGAQVNALVNESLAKKLKLAVEANRYALATFRALNSYTFEDSDHGLLIAEAVKKLEALHDETGEQR
jgi:hypothetical protein